MTYQGGAVACKGQWGMSDDAHDQPGQTSDFEFNLVEAESSDSKRLFPMDGKYEGWFYMKQVPPAKGVKVEDKEMMIKFLEQDASDEANASVGGNQKNYRIEGSGWNKFGKFNLRGSLSEHGDLHIYREYYFLTPAPVGRRKSVGQTPRAGSISRRGSFSAPGLSTDSADAAAAAGPQDTSPRESGRIRKQSSVMQEYTESKTPRSSVGSSSGFGASKQNSKHAEKQPMQRQESTGSTAERTQRLTGPLKKCHDLVRELSKHPQGLWFLEPVDYVAMNLPQYPKIIKNPMDFATVRSKIEAGKYEGAEDFAEDMRLIFRNAMEFNFQTDSPVHIAAREMLNRFEDRMRILNTQLGGINTYSAAVATSMTDGPPSKMARTSSTASVSSGGRGGAKRGGKAGRGAMSRSSSVSFGFVAPAAGPRPGFAAPPVPVLGTGSSSDASAHTIAEMQRMMQAMQEEINSLRAMVKQQEIVERLSESQ